MYEVHLGDSPLESEKLKRDCPCRSFRAAAGRSSSNRELVKAKITKVRIKPNFEPSRHSL